MKTSNPSSFKLKLSTCLQLIISSLLSFMIAIIKFCDEATFNHQIFEKVF